MEAGGVELMVHAILLAEDRCQRCRYTDVYRFSDMLFSVDGGLKIKNIQPFTKRDLEIRSLGDRILDISDITYLYPNRPKHEVFQKFYTGNDLYAQSHLHCEVQVVKVSL